MKILVWVTVVVLGLLWTAAAALGASLVGWGAGVLASGNATEWMRLAAQWPVPGWLAWWGVDPAAVKALQEAMLWSLQGLQHAWPWVAEAFRWLVPVVWLVWGLGLALMVVLGVLVHIVVGRGAGKLRGLRV